jgi:hypothetical protein
LKMNRLHSAIQPNLFVQRHQSNSTYQWQQSTSSHLHWRLYWIPCLALSFVKMDFSKVPLHQWTLFSPSLQFE